MTVSGRLLNWLPAPGRKNKVDCYADRSGHRWTVKRATMNHATFYVVRLNGALIKRAEFLEDGKRFAEEFQKSREEMT
jgi:hypothetical protein